MSIDEAKQQHPAVLLDLTCLLGEASLWIQQQQTWVFVDIDDCKLYHYSPYDSILHSHTLPAQIGTVVPTTTGGYILALADGIYSFQESKLTLIAHPEPHLMPTLNRFNEYEIMY